MLMGYGPPGCGMLNNDTLRLLRYHKDLYLLSSIDLILNEIVSHPIINVFHHEDTF